LNDLRHQSHGNYNVILKIITTGLSAEGTIVEARLKSYGSTEGAVSSRFSSENNDDYVMKPDSLSICSCGRND
jgi:hypothetical protein